ncbi:MAG: cyclic nucleotide-binding domain-containing protein [Gammaproteobacteria bacterium]|jgi:CRP/FNR family cyclic AMP-dependent transcriptional regulator
MSSDTTDVIVDAATIKSSPIGQELSDDQCAALSRVASAHGLESGMFLIEEGHQDDALYIITKGSLEVVKPAAGGDWVTLHVLRAGDMAGALGFVDGVEHSAAIRALSNSEVFSLSRQELEALLATDPDLVYKVMRAIVRTVHAILRRMNMQFVEMNNYITHQHGRY